uniref:Odorant receptor n=1 Tax=Spodoptera litura TaxID=69820 RepID=H6VN03_SPOLT|nr:putative olfactory receptor 3 [Spodoptera litura]
MGLKKFLFEDESVQGITAPTDYLYVKLLRMTLRIIATWPQTELGEKEPVYLNVFLKYFYLVATIGCQIGSYCYLRTYSDELTMMEAGHNYIMIMMTFIDISRITSLTFSTEYRKLCKEFFTKMHLFYFKDISEHAMATHKRVHLISHLFTLWLLFQMLFGVPLFNLVPMYYNYAAGRYKPGGTQNSTFEHSMYYQYPFDTLTEIKGYIVANIINWILSSLCVIWFCMCDLILLLMVFNIWGHLRMLTYTLNNFPRPSVETTITIDGGLTVTSAIYSDEENVQIFRKLKECVDYHRRIVEFNSKVSDVFGPMLIIYYLYHQTSGCLLLLECSQMTAPVLMRYLPLTIVCTRQLIQLSVIFELIGTESEKLPSAVYSVPWECMSISNKKFVIFFLMNVKEPIAVKPPGIANVGVTTMASILRTSLSYFTFLRSI